MRSGARAGWRRLARRILRVLTRESFRVIAGPGMVPALGRGWLTSVAAVAQDAGQRAITGTRHLID